MNADELRPQTGWRGPDSPRLAPLAAGEVRGAPVRVLLGWAHRLGWRQPPNVFLTLLRSPRLFWPWLVFASRLMPFGKLDARERERVILRVAWNCGCRYEWGQHAEIARRVGVGDDAIRRIAEPAEDDALLRACDEFHRERCLSDATWRELSAKHDAPTLIELCLLIGHYEMLAGFLNTVGTPLETDFEASLPKRPSH